MRLFYAFLLSVPLFYSSISFAQDRMLQLRKGQIASAETTFIGYTDLRSNDPKAFKDGVCVKNGCVIDSYRVMWNVIVKDNQGRSFQFENSTTIGLAQFVDKGETITSVAEKDYDLKYPYSLERIATINSGEFVEHSSNGLYCQVSLDLFINSETNAVKSARYNAFNCRPFCKKKCD